MDAFRQIWSRSKIYRVILVLTLVYFPVRTAAQLWLAVERQLPGQSQTQMIPNDLQDYMNAAARLVNHEPLYTPTHKMEYYQYPPAFALAIRPILWLPQGVNFALNFVLRLAGYLVFYLWWGRIFRKSGSSRAVELWAWTLPLWLVFSAFWADLSYMNIYLLTAMFATLFIDAVLAENLPLSVLWMTILLQTKPQWAFALAVPLLLGRWKFFLKLLAGGTVVNLLITGIFLLAVGPTYARQQILAYPAFLASLSTSFPWRGPATGFIGYNHSIMQIVMFVFGVSGSSYYLALIIKLLLLVPLVVVCIRNLVRPARRRGYEVPELALGLAFVLYLGVFIWLDMVWELSLGCAVFIFLLASQRENKGPRVLAWVVFMPYVLIDLWQFITYAIVGSQVVDANGYILTDYSIYIPVVMIVILVFYGILVRRLWPVHGKTMHTLEGAA